MKTIKLADVAPVKSLELAKGYSEKEMINVYSWEIEENGNVFNLQKTWPEAMQMVKSGYKYLYHNYKNTKQ